MGLEEYSFIHAVGYHDQILSERTRAEISSDGDALSSKTSAMLRGCLERQVEAMGPGGSEPSERLAVLYGSQSSRNILSPTSTARSGG
jgi:hypothetical protein